ncbi:MAG TPA: F0F1 ATP synthase subunit gamma [Desulfobacterales bacterium]|nr:F0F1 ATP synthase subunit gamma [Desulfobacterales bacterium]
METIESLKRKISSAQDLRSVVKTMKALAAVNIRQYEKAVESLAEYNRTVEIGFQILLMQRPAEVAIVEPALSESLGVIVFGSDQGMVGQFNEIIAQHTANEMATLRTDRQNVAVLAVGQRISSRLQEAGQPVEDVIAVPGSSAAITPTVQDVVLTIEAWRMQREIHRILLLYNKPLSGSSYRPHSLQVLPVDPEWFRDLQYRPWPCRAVPLFTMDWNRLLSTLIRQYLFVSIYRAFAESLASENASRLASMQVAERNIEDRLEELHAQFHQRRQTTIMEELFDIVTGFEALTGESTQRQP